MPSAQQLRQQTLALAAIAQAVHLADRIARTGSAEPQAFEATLLSLFAFAAEDAERAYGGVANLELGLRRLSDMLVGNPTVDTRQLIRYALSVLHLQKQLKRHPETGGVIRSRLEHTQKNIDFNGFDASAIASSVAAIYQDTISHFRFRIQVSGSMQQLQNPANAARIRSLLLAAVRAAYLWRQAGGSRLSLVFGRQRLLRECRQLLDREIPR